MKLAVGILLSSLVVGCVKSSDKCSTGAENPGSDAADGDAEGDGGQDVDPAGELAIDTGSMQLNVATLSSADSFAAANASLNDQAAQPGTLTLGLGLSLTDDASSSSSATPPVSWPASDLNSIASGPPDGFKVAVTSIVLDSYTPGQSLQGGPGGDAGDGTEAPRAVLLDKPEGVWLAVESGQMDLQELLAVSATDGTVPAFKVPVGSYNRIAITFKRKGKIKGCVAGTFTTNGQGVPEAEGQHTYCTRAGYSSFDAVTPGPDAYEGLAAAEWMDFDLGMSDIGPAAAEETLSKYVELKAPLVVEKDATLDLSMVLDLNRMLRFFNRGRLDQGPNPSAPKDRAYFFTSVFDASLYMFAGKPGRIYGYQALAEACTFAGFDSGAGTCSDDQGTVPFWMTLITAASGEPIVTSIMPDDDNDLTILKGTNRGLDQPYTAAAAGFANIHYFLDAELGKLRDVPVALDDTAVGDEIGGVTFEAHQQDGGDFQGKVHIIRRL